MAGFLDKFKTRILTQNTKNSKINNLSAHFKGIGSKMAGKTDENSKFKKLNLKPNAKIEPKFRTDCEYQKEKMAKNFEKYIDTKVAVKPLRGYQYRLGYAVHKTRQRASFLSGKTRFAISLAAAVGITAFFAKEIFVLSVVGVGAVVFYLVFGRIGLNVIGTLRRRISLFLNFDKTKKTKKQLMNTKMVGNKPLPPNLDESMRQNSQVSNFVKKIEELGYIERHALFVYYKFAQTFGEILKNIVAKKIENQIGVPIFVSTNMMRKAQSTAFDLIRKHCQKELGSNMKCFQINSHSAMGKDGSIKAVLSFTVRGDKNTGCASLVYDPIRTLTGGVKVLSLIVDFGRQVPLRIV